MARVKRGVTQRARHKKVIKAASGYVGRNGSTFRPALERLEKALRYAYRDRRAKKREFRALWIQRINAAARLNGMTYNALMHGLKQANMDIDRKVLADLAVKDAAGFSKLVELVRASGA